MDDIRAWGQTIVYTVHEHVGHLGIFVSGGVARKEHDEFASNIDLIDVLPPGLYEAVLTPKGEAVDNPDLVTGEWVMRCEARTLDDIRALGGNDLADERKFAAAARLSEINLALYRTFAQPAVRAMVIAAARRGDAPDAPAPALLRDSSARATPGSPGSTPPPSASAPPAARARPATRSSPRRRALSQQIVDGFEAYRRSVERLSEDTFHAIYGTPALQAALGIDTELDPAARARRHAASCTRRWSSAAPRQLAAAMTRGRPARGAGPRAALGRHGPPRRRRARLRGDHPAARRPRGEPPDDARRLQGAGPRRSTRC